VVRSTTTTRIARRLGFGLALVASALLSLAHGFVLVLCAEPDGCIELEFVEAGDPTTASCVPDEHEDAPAGELGVSEASPCEDTVIAALTTPMPGKPAKVASIELPSSPSPAAIDSNPFVASHRAAHLAPRRAPARASPDLSRSVVRRN